MKIKTILLLLTIILLTGCSNNKKCVKSHEEKDICFYYIYHQIGDVGMMTPIYYSCTKTICDEYVEK